MWSDSIASNRAARAAAHEQGDIGEVLHAMDYLVYAFVQEGRDQEAAEVIRKIRQMQKLNEGDFKVAYASTAMPVRYAVQRHRWTEAATIESPPGAPPHVVAITVWARALGLARSGRPAEVRPEIDKLHGLERQLRVAGNEYWAKQVRIQAMEAEAWLAQAEGRPDDAQEHRAERVRRIPVRQQLRPESRRSDSRSRQHGLRRLQNWQLGCGPAGAVSRARSREKRQVGDFQKKVTPKGHGNLPPLDGNPARRRGGLAHDNEGAQGRAIRRMGEPGGFLHCQAR